MRTLVVVGLLAGAVAVFAPDEGAGLMRSVVHGLGWGIGREVAHNTSRRCLEKRSLARRRETPAGGKGFSIGAATAVADWMVRFHATTCRAEV
jgi:hypothetical protein